MSNYGRAKVGHRKDKHGNVKAYNRFMADLAEQIDENVQQLLETEVEDIQDEVEEIANNELLNYYNVVSKYMGQENKPHLREAGGTSYKFDVFNRVVWFPLSKRTRELKRQIAGEGAQNIKWYSFYKNPHGGSPLKDYLNGIVFQGSATARVEKVAKGDARTWGKQKRKGAYFYQLTLDIPLDEGDIVEQMGGDENAQVVKAFGHPRGRFSNEERRPIFNPIAEYFVRQRIPRVIKEIMKKRGRDVELG